MTARRFLWLVAALTFTGLSAEAAPSVFGETSSVKVRPNYPARDDHGVDLTGARNEFMSFQVVVQGGASGASGVTASLNALAGPSSIPASEITLYREALINITTSSGGVGETGAWPDGLVPDTDEIAHEKRNAFPFNVPANEARAIWVDVHIPDNAAPGSYTGMVSVSGSGFNSQVPVRLTVVNATLPSTSSVASAYLVFAGPVCTLHTGNSDCGGSTTAMSDALALYERLALDHRISLSNTFVIGKQGDNWPAFDAAYSQFLNGTAATRLKGAKVTSVKLLADRNVTGFSSWAAHFKAKGWMDKLFDYTGDEPPYGITFSQLQANAQVTRSADPSIKTLVTSTSAELTKNNLDSLIDTVVPVVNYLDGVDAPYVGNQRSSYDSFLSQPNKSLWMYQSCMSQGCAYGSNLAENAPGSGWPSYMIDRSAAKNRAMQWLLFKYKATGELYYDTTTALETAWTDQFRFDGNGDGTLFYAGTPATIGGSTTVPLPSIRMKQIRLGMQDYEWLKLVSDAGDPAFAKQVVDQLLPTAHQVPDDGAAFDTARAKLVQRYVQLTTPPTKPTDPTQPSQPTIPGTPATASPQEGTATAVDGTPTSTTTETDPTGTVGGGLDNPTTISTTQPSGAAKGHVGCAVADSSLFLFGALGALSQLLSRRRKQ